MFNNWSLNGTHKSPQVFYIFVIQKYKNNIVQLHGWYKAWITFPIFIISFLPACPQIHFDPLWPWRYSFAS